MIIDVNKPSGILLKVFNLYLYSDRKLLLTNSGDLLQTNPCHSGSKYQIKHSILFVFCPKERMGFAKHFFSLTYEFGRNNGFFILTYVAYDM